MITDEMLRKAAARSNELYVDYFESTYDSECQHAFSLQFQKKIEKLKRKVRHPYFYSPLARVASIVLAVAVSVSIWLAVDVEAREAFFGWIKEVYETHFVYRYKDGSDDAASTKEYELTWIPDGYTEVLRDNTFGTVSVLYENDKGDLLKFRYAYNPDDDVLWFVDASQTARKSATVNGSAADLLISTDPKIAGAICWVSADNTAFYISAFAEESDLIKIAESVQEKN